MTDQILIRAERREAFGKGAARRLRRLENRAPAILYGGSQEPVPLSIDYPSLAKSMQEEAFFSQILRLQVDGDEAQACVLRAVQRHPATERVEHLDFQRIREELPVHMHVPLHFVNEEQCVGVKLGGGRLAHNLIEVEVRCLPKDLPEFIAVDVPDLEAGRSLPLSDLMVPAEVEIVALGLGADHDIPVVSVTSRRGGAASDEDEGQEEGEGEDDQAEPAG